MKYDCRVDESLMIGDDVELTVLEIVGRNVRVGIRQMGAVPAYWEAVLTANDGDNGDDGSEDEGDFDADSWTPNRFDLPATSAFSA